MLKGSTKVLIGVGIGVVALYYIGKKAVDAAIAAGDVLANAPIDAAKSLIAEGKQEISSGVNVAENYIANAGLTIFSLFDNLFYSGPDVAPIQNPLGGSGPITSDPFTTPPPDGTGLNYPGPVPYDPSQDPINQSFIDDVYLGG